MDRKQIEDVYLESAVEQHLLEEQAPDVVAAVLRRGMRPVAAPSKSKERWSWAAAAAVILAGIGIVWGVAVSNRSEDPVATPTQQGDNAQDPDKPPVQRESVKPSSADEFRALVAQATGAIVQVQRGYPLGVPEPVLPVRVPGEPAIEWMPLSWNADVSAKLAGSIQGDVGGPAIGRPAIGRPGSDGKFAFGSKRIEMAQPDYVRLLLPGRKYVECAFQIDIRAGGGFSSGTSEGFVSVPGIGAYPCKEVQDAWLPEILRAGRTVLHRRGVLHGKQMTPDYVGTFDFEAARVHEFERAQLTYLAGQKRLKRLDIRYSPKLLREDVFGHLKRIPALEELFLLPSGSVAGTQEWRRAVRSLPEITSLRAFHALPTGVTPWTVPGLEESAFSRGAPGLGLPPNPVDAMKRATSLRAFSAHGLWQGDEALRGLAKLPLLETLSLAQCPNLRGTVFAELGKRQTLRNLYLNGCSGLSDDGIRAIAALPGLRGLYLHGSRGQLTPGALRALADAPNLRRLELGGWFDQSFRSTLPKPISLTTEWRGARRALAESDTLEWLALSECRYLTKGDFEPLTHAKRLTTLVLAGTVGDREGEVPFDDVGPWLMDAIEGVTIIMN